MRDERDDCARFAGTVCIDGGCAQGPAIELPDGAFDTGPVIGSPCSSNQDCIANGPYICRHTDNTCQALFANGCGSVAGSYSSDDTVLIGAILPLSGPHASTGTAMADAITLGVSDFDLGGGLPPLLDGGLRRPVAVLFCDENDESAGAAATHLIALGIAILIGTGDSESTADVAGNKSVPGGALLMAPRAPAGALRLPHRRPRLEDVPVVDDRGERDRGAPHPDGGACARAGRRRGGRRAPSVGRDRARERRRVDRASLIRRS